VKFNMNCEMAKAALVECARQGVPPEGVLKSHLAECRACDTRWESERNLTAHLRALHIASVPESIEFSKAVLLREFDANQKRERNMRRMRSVAWVMSSAAALIFSVVAMRDISATRPAAPEKVAAHAYALPEYAQESFAPAEEAGEKGFIAVPFATPLAPNEILRIVRTELHPAALASMGVNVEPGWEGALPADLLVGQDGFPRAVRVSNDDLDERNAE
jgi:hypothetical protein